MIDHAVFDQVCIQAWIVQAYASSCKSDLNCNRFLCISCQLVDAPCRGLALLNNIGVVSASHDQTLKVWTFEGDCIAELVGHTALVYSAACSDDGSLIASASEDNTVRTWRPDGQSLQTLEHPGTHTPPITF